MSTSKHIDRICIAALAVMLVLTLLFMNGEKLGIEVIIDEEESGYFSQNDILSDWDTSDATFITLSDNGSVVSGNGAYVKKGDIHISFAGKYVVSGSLSDGRIIIDADGDDMIRLMLYDANIACEDSAAILVERADRVFLTLADGTENTLSSGESYSETAKKAGIDGVIYSRDDLTVNGRGALRIIGKYRHGIVCNDSLKITAGNITVSAPQDAIHANDCVCIKDATLDLNAGDDGITVSNEEQSDYLYIYSGNIRISGCYEGLEATTVTVAGGNIDITSTDDGINANELIEISGGSVRIVNENGCDADGLDSNKDIVITGGKLFISVSQSGGSCAVDYGSENHGECRIDGGTVIACGSNAMLEAISTNSKQAFIMKNVSGEANTVLTLVSSAGTRLISETIPVGFSSVTLSTPEMENGDVCTLTVGNSTQEITVDSSAETIGGNGFGLDRMDGAWNAFGRGDIPPEMPVGNGNTPPPMPDDHQNAHDNGNMSGWQGGTPPEMPNGDGRSEPQRPDGNMAPFFGADREQGGNMNVQRPDGNMSFDLRSDQIREELTDTSVKAQWGAVGLSAFALAAGLFIALKKKY